MRKVVIGAMRGVGMMKVNQTEAPRENPRILEVVASARRRCPSGFLRKKAVSLLGSAPPMLPLPHTGSR